MQVFKSGISIVVDPDLPELRDALDAILSVRSLDSLVSSALRQHGFMSEGWSAIYFSDEQDWEVTNEIPDGFMEICCFGCGDEVGILIEVDRYLQLLIEVCKFQKLNKRAELLTKFRDNPGIANDLIEADPLKCKDRWRKFIPFLENNGWCIVGTMIESPHSTIKFHATEYDEDLEVICRDAKLVIKNYPLGIKEVMEDYKSLVKTLEYFFDSELS
jgi:hypothetical protein